MRLGVAVAARFVRDDGGGASALHWRAATLFSLVSPMLRFSCTAAARKRFRAADVVRAILVSISAELEAVRQLDVLRAS